MRCAHEACRQWRPAFLAARGGRGVSFDDAWFCSRACLEAETRSRLELAPAPEGAWGIGRNVSRLGALLIHRRLIAAPVLAEALARQAASGRRLGAELVAMGALTPVDLLRTLATQARSGYLTAIDPERVRTAPGGLSRDVILALGVVPIDADETKGRLFVACAAPLPRPSLAVLRALVPLPVEPLLVDDETAAALLAAYGTAPARTRVTRASSMRDAVERITTAIETGGARRLRPVRCESFLWVRLEGGDVPEEIVLPSRIARAHHPGAHAGAAGPPSSRADSLAAGHTRKDETWQAARTAH
jgi:hypothetical protein